MLRLLTIHIFVFFFSSRRRHTRLQGDWSSDVCSSDLQIVERGKPLPRAEALFELLARVRATLLHEAEGNVEQDLLVDGKPNILPTCLSIVGELPHENEPRR